MTASEADANHPDNKKLVADANFSGPGNDRKCTDVLFCLLLIAAWVIMTVLGFIVLGYFENDHLSKGNPYRLINGMDDAGNICGVTDVVKNFGNQYTTVDGTKKICVASCPTETCASCVVDYLGTTYAGLASTSFIGYCVFDDAAEAATSGSSTASGWEDITADLWTASGYIGGFGFPFAAAVGFLYLVLLRIPGLVFVLVWTSVAVILAMLVVLGVKLLDESQKWDDAEPQVHSDSDITLMRACAYIAFIAAALYVCLMIFLRKRISLAMGVIKEAARCVAAIPALVVFPLLQASGAVVFTVIWVVYALYLASSGELTTSTVSGLPVRTMSYTSDTQYALLYMVFIFFWTTQFIIAFGQIVCALAVSSWYFVRDKSAIGSATLFSAIRITAFYHTGTAAFGALIIAIIKTIRAVVSYLQAKAKASQNKTAQVLLCLLQCCMWCFEKCMKFLNENAYTQTAIFGVSFCTAARRAFFLILRNAARVAAVSMVGNFVMFIGKLMVTLAAAGAAYLAMEANISEDLHGLMSPTILCALCAYMTASVFLDVFDMAITTILQCFLADEEMFEGDQRFAEKDLKEWVNENGSGKEDLLSANKAGSGV